MVKVVPNFREAAKFLNKADLSDVCDVMNLISAVKWRLNKPVLEIIEYVWSIGGGLGEIPRRFNDRLITPAMLKQAKFKEKLKLLKEHQVNKEIHGLRCEFLLRLSIA